MTATTTGQAVIFRKVVALEGWRLLVLVALGEVADQRVAEPGQVDRGNYLNTKHMRSETHRLRRRRHHSRRWRPGHSIATPGVGELEAELQEELLGFPEEKKEKCIN